MKLFRKLYWGGFQKGKGGGGWCKGEGKQPHIKRGGESEVEEKTGKEPSGLVVIASTMATNITRRGRNGAPSGDLVKKGPRRG